MPELRFVQVDAFADRPFTGNPAAVVPLEDWLPDEVLQAIAEENNLSETAFTVPATDGAADYELRWFTPTVEVALCGHATLASGHVLLGDDDRLRFRTRRSGILVVARDGAGDSARPELYLSYEGSEGVAILLFADEAAVRALRPDMKRLAEIDYMVIATAPGDRGHDVVSRVFVPAWGVDEDPVTGSAHAALTPFWTERLGRDSFTAYQASRRGGRIECRAQGDRAILSGRCVTVIEGVLRV
jgi:predicted PhzF superfamily epimerase YddE/YHI9